MEAAGSNPVRTARQEPASFRMRVLSFPRPPHVSDVFPAAARLSDRRALARPSRRLCDRRAVSATVAPFPPDGGYFLAYDKGRR
ncbi:hypothetical protein, partial [Streptomyces corynorhini]|uniref:hypothetical protein n=1 Tax=Streptomyces corynorhini TaxID=2282652 RepID=UPI001F17F910